MNLEEAVKNIHDKLEFSLNNDLLKKGEETPQKVLNIVGAEILKLNEAMNIKEIISFISEKFGIELKYHPFQKAVLREKKSFKHKENKRQQDPEKISTSIHQLEKESISNKKTKNTEEKKGSKNWIDNLKGVSDHFKLVVKKSCITESEFNSLDLYLGNQSESLSKINDFISSKTKIGNTIYNQAKESKND